MAYFKRRLRQGVFLTICVFAFLISGGCLQKPADSLMSEKGDNVITSKIDQKVIQLVTDNNAPYQFEDGGVIAGLATDIVNQVFNHIGYTVELRMLPWTRALKMVQDQEVDGIFCTYYSKERAVYLNFMKEPIAFDIQAIYTLKGSSLKFDGTMKSLESYRIGILQDWFYGDDFERAVKEGRLTVEKVTELPVNIQKLLDGKVDAIINPQINTQYYLKTMNVQTQVVENTIPLREPAAIYLAFAKDRGIEEALIESLDAELLKMKADGSYQSIMDRYTQ